MTKQEEIREGLLHEICCICVHKPTSIENGLFVDSPKTLKGLGCTFGFDEESKQYCPLAHKVAKAIVMNLHSRGVVIKVDRELPPNIFVDEFGHSRSGLHGQAVGWVRCKEAVVKAGYEAAELLIEEQK